MSKPKRLGEAPLPDRLAQRGSEKEIDAYRRWAGCRECGNSDPVHLHRRRMPETDRIIDYMTCPNCPPTVWKIKEVLPTDDGYDNRKVTHFKPRRTTWH